MSLTLYNSIGWAVEKQTIAAGGGLTGPVLVSAVSTDPNTVRLTFDRKLMLEYRQGGVYHAATLDLPSYSIVKVADSSPLEIARVYIWTVKENQPRTHWAIQKLFVHEVCNLRQGCALNPDFQMVTRINKNRGRLEKRTLTASSLLNDYLDWPYVAQIFRLEKTIWHPKHKGKTREIVYGLTSLSAEKANPDKLLSLLRQYWGIEAGLHFRRDVTLHEDATRLTIGKSGHNMAILNNLVIGICLHLGFQNLAKARRLFCAQPQKALDLILSDVPTL